MPGHLDEPKCAGFIPRFCASEPNYDDWRKLANNQDKRYDFSPFYTMLCGSGNTATRKVLMRIDFWLYLIYFVALEYISWQYKLPMMEDKWTLLGFLMSLTTFTLVFFLSGTWSRYLSLYGHFSSMSDAILEYATLAVASIPGPIPVVTTKMMLASMFLRQRRIRPEAGYCFPDLLSELLEPTQVQQVNACETRGENAANMVDVWAINELRKSDIKGPELNTLQGKIISLARTCRSISATQAMPVPFEYYHMANVLLMVTFAMLGYILAAMNSTSVIIIYILVALSFFGLRELAIDLSEPFSNYHLDFPAEANLQGTIEEAIAIVKAGPVQFESKQANEKTPLCW